MIGVQAQTDVTAQYITNADFSSTDGWTANQSTQFNAIGNGLIGTYQVNSGVAATVDDNHPATAYCLGFQSRWSTNYSYYTQETAELPAGYYRLTFDVQNTNSGTTSCIYDNFFSVTVGADKYIDSHYRFRKTEWMAANTDWTTHTIYFRVKMPQAVTVSLGYGQATNNYGNTATPYIYVSNLKLEQFSSKPEGVFAIDKTGLITNNDMTANVNGWSSTTGAQNQARATNQTGDFRGGFYENWNGSAYTGKMYQTLSGVPAGVYELSLCAFVNTYGDGETQYIYAGSATAGLTQGAPTQYTVTNIEVPAGTLEIGFEQTKATANWCGIDYATLTKIGDPDLSTLVEAYETALANAKAFDQTQTMSATWKAALNTTISTYDEGKVDEEDQDALETAIAALESALAVAEKSVASYAVIAAGSVPDNSVEGWVCENPQGIHVNTWSVEGNSDGSGMTTPFIENWVGKGSYLGAGRVYYQLQALEPGEVYYAQALVRSYNEANSDAPNGPDFFVNDAVTSLSVAGTTFTYNGMSGIYATLGSQATVGEDGTLTLGVEIADDRNYNWVAFKSVKIQELSAAYNEAVAAAEALEGQIPAAAYNNLMDEIAGYSTVTIENIENINAAVATYSALKSPYAEFYTLKAKADVLVAVANDNPTANATLADAITAQAAAVEAATTAEGINTATSTLKTAMTTYVGLANPVGDGSKFDCTFLMTNPDVTSFASWTSYTDVPGWGSDQSDGNRQVMHNDGVACVKGNAFFEYWSETPKANGLFALYNTVEDLPEGTYEINCYALATANGYAEASVSKVYFYANDTEGSLISSDVLTQASISFVNNAEQDVKIGLKPMTGNTFRWMGIGYVELYKVPAKTYTVDEEEDWDYTAEGAGDVTLNRTIKVGINTLVLPFSMTQAEVESTFGEDSKVYVVSSYNTDNENITFDTHDGISANLPCLLKATVAGTSYEIEGRTITAATSAAPALVLESVSMIGGYNATNDIAANSYNYVISGDKIYFADVALTMKGTRAYIKTASSNPGARELIMILDDDPTAINSIEASEEAGALKDGKYFINGRFVIVNNGLVFGANGQLLK